MQLYSFKINRKCIENWLVVSVNERVDILHFSDGRRGVALSVCQNAALRTTQPYRRLLIGQNEIPDDIDLNW